MTSLLVLGIPFLLSILLFLFNINTFEIKPKILLCLEFLLCFIPYCNVIGEAIFTVVRCCCSEPDTEPEFFECEIKDTSLNRWLFDNYDDNDWPNSEEPYKDSETIIREYLEKQEDGKQFRV